MHLNQKETMSDAQHNHISIYLLRNLANKITSCTPESPCHISPTKPQCISKFHQNTYVHKLKAKDDVIKGGTTQVFWNGLEPITTDKKGITCHNYSGPHKILWKFSLMFFFILSSSRQLIGCTSEGWLTCSYKKEGVRSKRARKKNYRNLKKGILPSCRELRLSSLTESASLLKKRNLDIGTLRKAC